MSNLDVFYDEIMETKKRVISGISKEDILNHLHRIIYILGACIFMSILTLWLSFPFNRFPIIFMSIYQTYKWTIVGHHVCHGGYDKCDDFKYKKKGLELVHCGEDLQIGSTGYILKLGNLNIINFTIVIWEKKKDPDRPGYVFSDLFETFGINNRLFKILAFLNCMMCWRFIQYPINSYDKYFSSKNINTDEEVYIPIRLPQ
jgi:hypothetical protein